MSVWLISDGNSQIVINEVQMVIFESPHPTDRAEYAVSLGYSQRQIREYPKYLLIPYICEKRLALLLMRTK